LTLAERKAAAEHYIAAIVDAVSTPADDDAAVIALMQPPEWDGPMAEYQPTVRRIVNEQRGWASSGPSPAQARRHVQEQRRTDLLKAIYTNREPHSLEREAAAQRLLDSLPPSSMQRRNGFTAQRLIQEAK
jgi:hypothetical protein